MTRLFSLWPFWLKIATVITDESRTFFCFCMAWPYCGTHGHTVQDLAVADFLRLQELEDEEKKAVERINLLIS